MKSLKQILMWNYRYDSDKCVMGSFDEILEYISECKRAKKIIEKGK